MSSRPKTDDEPAWQPGFDSGLPWFDDLRHIYSCTLPATWPQPEDLNGLLHQSGNTSIRFAPQTRAFAALEYEQMIAEQRTVPMRGGNWHDVFNALMWLSFPATKHALNQIHINAPVIPGRRSRSRDFATLFDEAGVIVTYADGSPDHFNRNHDWQQLFIGQRSQWWQSWRPFIIGHGLYEQSLKPYIGLTAKAFYWPVEQSFYTLDLTRQYQQLDRDISHWLTTQTDLSSRHLMPLPLLGIPGWWKANQDAGFYANRNYFRPRRQD